LLSRAGKLATSNADKAEVPNTIFASTITGIAGPQITGSSSYDNACVNPALTVEGLICSLLQGLNTHTPMGLDRIYPKVLREVADMQGHCL